MAVCFLLQETASALPALTTAPAPASAAVSAPAFSISEFIQDPARIDVPLGAVMLQEVHAGTSGRLIIHIQDAHANLSGQQALAKAVEHFIAKYGLRVVLVEGADRDVTLDEVRKLAPLQEWSVIARRFLYEGIISGEEYLNLTTEHPMKLRGIEYQELYDESVKTYAALVDRRKDILDYLYRAKVSLERLKQRMYPQTLKDYEQKRGSGDPDNGAGFADMLKLLFKLLPEAGVDLSEYPALASLKEAMDRESSLDFESANREQARILGRLDPEDARAFSEMSRRLRYSQVSQYRLTRQLLDQASERGSDPADFPELAAYAEYLKRFLDLKMEEVMIEQERLEDRIFDELLPDDDARKVRAIDRFLGLLGNAYKLQMSSHNFAMHEFNEKEFPTGSWLAFLNRKLADLGFFESLVPTEGHLDEAYGDFKKFYRLVSDRDGAFIENTRNILDEEKADAAILIAGGYHTEHLTRLLREQEDSYIVLTPLVTDGTDHAKYEKILLQHLKDQERQLAARAAKGDGPAGSAQDTGLNRAENVAATRIPRGIRALPAAVRLTSVDSGARMAAFDWVNKRVPGLSGSIARAARGLLGRNRPNDAQTGTGRAAAEPQRSSTALRPWLNDWEGSFKDAGPAEMKFEGGAGQETSANADKVHQFIFGSPELSSVPPFVKLYLFYLLSARVSAQGIEPYVTLHQLNLEPNPKNPANSRWSMQVSDVGRGVAEPFRIEGSIGSLSGDFPGVDRFMMVIGQKLKSGSSIDGLLSKDLSGFGVERSTATRLLLAMITHGEWADHPFIASEFEAEGDIEELRQRIRDDLGGQGVQVQGRDKAVQEINQVLETVNLWQHSPFRSVHLPKELADKKELAERDPALRIRLNRFLLKRAYPDIAFNGVQVGIRDPLTGLMQIGGPEMVQLSLPNFTLSAYETARFDEFNEARKAGEALKELHHDVAQIELLLGRPGAEVLSGEMSIETRSSLEQSLLSGDVSVHREMAQAIWEVSADLGTLLPHKLQRAVLMARLNGRVLEDEAYSDYLTRSTLYNALNSESIERLEKRLSAMLAIPGMRQAVLQSEYRRIIDGEAVMAKRELLLGEHLASAAAALKDARQRIARPQRPVLGSGPVVEGTAYPGLLGAMFPTLENPAGNSGYALFSTLGSGKPGVLGQMDLQDLLRLRDSGSLEKLGLELVYTDRIPGLKNFGDRREFILYDPLKLRQTLLTTIDGSSDRLLTPRLAQELGEDPRTVFQSIVDADVSMTDNFLRHDQMIALGLMLGYRWQDVMQFRRGTGTDPRTILTSMDPATRERVEATLGVELDEQGIERLLGLDVHRQDAVAWSIGKDQGFEDTVQLVELLSDWRRGYEKARDALLSLPKDIGRPQRPATVVPLAKPYEGVAIPRRSKDAGARMAGPAAKLEGTEIWDHISARGGSVDPHSAGTLKSSYDLSLRTAALVMQESVDPASVRDVQLNGGTLDDLTIFSAQYPTARFVVVNVDEAALRRIDTDLKRRASEGLAVPAVELHLADASELSTLEKEHFPDASMDLVIAVGLDESAFPVMISGQQAVERVLGGIVYNEVRRVKPGGHLLHLMTAEVERKKYFMPYYADGSLVSVPILKGLYKKPMVTIRVGDADRQLVPVRRGENWQSNMNFVYADQNGKEYFVKVVNEPAQAVAERIGHGLFGLLGLPVQELYQTVPYENGKWAVVSPLENPFTSASIESPDFSRPEIRRIFGLAYYAHAFLNTSDGPLLRNVGIRQNSGVRDVFFTDFDRSLGLRTSDEDKLVRSEYLPSLEYNLTDPFVGEKMRTNVAYLSESTDPQMRGEFIARMGEAWPQLKTLIARTEADIEAAFSRTGDGAIGFRKGELSEKMERTLKDLGALPADPQSGARMAGLADRRQFLIGMTASALFAAFTSRSGAQTDAVRPTGLDPLRKTLDQGKVDRFMSLWSQQPFMTRAQAVKNGVLGESGAASVSPELARYIDMIYQPHGEGDAAHAADAPDPVQGINRLLAPHGYMMIFLRVDDQDRRVMAFYKADTIRTYRSGVSEKTPATVLFGRMMSGESFGLSGFTMRDLPVAFVDSGRLRQTADRIARMLGPDAPAAERWDDLLTYTDVTGGELAKVQLELIRKDFTDSGRVVDAGTIFERLQMGTLSNELTHVFDGITGTKLKNLQAGAADIKSDLAEGSTPAVQVQRFRLAELAHNAMVAYDDPTLGTGYGMENLKGLFDIYEAGKKLGSWRPVDRLEKYTGDPSAIEALAQKTAEVDRAEAVLLLLRTFLAADTADWRRVFRTAYEKRFPGQPLWSDPAQRPGVSKTGARMAFAAGPWKVGSISTSEEIVQAIREREGMVLEQLDRMGADADTAEIAAGLLDVTRRIYEQQGLAASPNYHNHLHNLLVVHSALILSDTGRAAIRTGQDGPDRQQQLLLIFTAALLHDFRIESAPAAGGKYTPADVTNSLGQIRKILGLSEKRLLVRSGFGLDNARRARLGITFFDSSYADLRTRMGELLHQIADRFGGPENFMRSLQPVIRATDFPSDKAPVQAIQSTEEKWLSIARQAVEQSVSPVPDANSRASKIMRSLRQTARARTIRLRSIPNTMRAGIEHRIRRTSQRLGRVLGIQEAYLRDLMKVPAEERAWIHTQAQALTAADQLSYYLLLDPKAVEDVVKALVLEGVVASADGTFPFFMSSQFLNEGVLDVVSALPEEVRRNFAAVIEHFHGLSKGSPKPFIAGHTSVIKYDSDAVERGTRGWVRVQLGLEAKPVKPARSSGSAYPLLRESLLVSGTVSVFNVADQQYSIVLTRMPQGRIFRTLHAFGDAYVHGFDPNRVAAMNVSKGTIDLMSASSGTGSRIVSPSLGEVLTLGRPEQLAGLERSELRRMAQLARGISEKRSVVIGLPAELHSALGEEALGRFSQKLQQQNPGEALNVVFVSYLQGEQEGVRSAHPGADVILFSPSEPLSAQTAPLFLGSGLLGYESDPSGTGKYPNMARAIVFAVTLALEKRPSDLQDRSSVRNLFGASASGRALEAMKLLERTEQISLIVNHSIPAELKGPELEAAFLSILETSWSA